MIAALELIKSFEGVMDGNPMTVNLDPYLCPAGYWTIGWGHVVRDAQGKMLTGAGNRAQARAVYPHGITRAEAETLLKEDARKVAAGVDSRVLVDLNANQRAALISFAYNVGLSAFGRSTLLTRINMGDLDAVPGELLRWIRAGGRVLPGLRRRRQEEANLWRTKP